MTVFFHYLQSNTAVVRVSDSLDRRAIDADDLVKRSISRPPSDTFNSYVLSETSMAELSHAEDIYMAKQGFSLEGLDDAQARLKVDDEFIKNRLQSRMPKRFGFEVHSDDGKYMRATIVECQAEGSIKTALDAKSIIVTTFDAVLGDDGKIDHAEVYPVRVRIYPDEFVKPLTADDLLGVPRKSPIMEPSHVPIVYKDEAKPAGSVVVEVAARAKPASLPGLGKPLAAAPKASVFDDLNRHLQATSGAGVRTSMKVAPTSQEELVRIAQLIMDRFNEAMMLMHVQGRNPALVQQQSKDPSGVIKVRGIKGQYSGVHRINVDATEFRVLVSQRVQHIRDAMENPKRASYAVPGLVLVKKHDRHLGSGTVPVIAHAKCDNEAVRIEATHLLQQIDIDPEAYDNLARLVERWGAEQTKERMAQAGVYKVNITPERNNPKPQQLKTRREP